MERGKYVEPGRTRETLPKIRRMLQNKSRKPGQTAAVRSPSGPQLTPAAIRTNPSRHCDRPVPPPPRSITGATRHGAPHPPPRPTPAQSHRTCSSPAAQRCLRPGTEGFPLTPPRSQPVWLWERTPGRAATHGGKFQLNSSPCLLPNIPPGADALTAAVSCGQGAAGAQPAAGSQPPPEHAPTGLCPSARRGGRARFRGGAGAVRRGRVRLRSWWRSLWRLSPSSLAVLTAGASGSGRVCLCVVLGCFLAAVVGRVEGRLCLENHGIIE